MLLQRIRINNFMSHINTELVFDHNTHDPYLIIGDNGSGKSSIIEALYWCLYGDVIRSSDIDSVLSKYTDSKDCLVQVDLVDAVTNISISIIRARNHSKFGNNFVQYSVNDKVYSFNKVTDAQAELDKLFGDYRLFLNTVMFGQGLNRFFANSRIVKEEERKKILECVIGMEDFKVYQKRAQEERDKYFSNKDKALAMEISYNDVLDKMIEMKKVAISNIEADLKQEINVLSSKRLDIEGELNSVREKLDLMISEGVSLEKVLSKNRSELLLIQSCCLELKRREDRLLNDIRQYKEYLTSPNSVISIGQVCPSCYRIIDESSLSGFIDHVNKSILSCEEELKEIRSELLSLKDNSDRINSIIKETEVSLSNHQRLYESLKQRVEFLDTALQETVARINSLEKKLSQTRESGAVDYIDNKIVEVRSKLESIKSKILRYDSFIEAYSFWVEAFSDRGIKNMIFDEVFPVFNDRINMYLDRLTNGVIKLRVTTTTLTKKEKLKDKVNITVLMKNRSQSYEECSGGEARRIDIAIMLALRDLAIATSVGRRYPLNIVCMDEVTDWLDTEGVQAVVYYLKELALTNTVIIISHSELKSYFNNVITVQKGEIGSSVVWGM